MDMATPHFEPLKNNQELLAVLDVCMKCDADKSEQRIDLIPGGKHSCRPIAVAARYKASVCGRSLAGIVGSNSTGGMDVCLL